MLKVIILRSLVKRFLKHFDAEGALFLLHHSQQDRLPAIVQENEPTQDQRTDLGNGRNQATLSEEK